MKSVIFDLDGTLYDNKGLPLKLVLGDIRNMWVLGAERKARKAIKGTDFHDAAGVYDALFSKMVEVKPSLTVEKARTWYQQKYMPLQVAVLALYFQPRPLVIELLESLHEQGIKVILYSDYGHETEKIEALGIPAELFDGIVSAAKMGGLKPCRESMLRLIDQFGLNPAETLYVGDREDTDGESARAVGIKFVNVKKDRNAWDNLLKSLLSDQ
ncbi:MAG: HAD family hydrolase [Bacteroidales bacterium]|nr:HAD family hydrolase [Candidatus Liminaster caballi]